MNWLYVGLPLAGIYFIWFGYLLSRKKYSKQLLLFALAHFPYLIINLVAPFRGALDPDYAGYAIGWIVLPKGMLVPLVTGIIVISSLILASRALLNQMEGIWAYAFIFDLFLSISIALPLFLDIILDLAGSTIELGEYFTISGISVAIIVLSLFSGPTFYACFLAFRNVITKGKDISELSQN